MNIKTLFDSGRIVGVVGDANTCKSNLLYFLISKIKDFDVDLYQYGLRIEVDGVLRINSIDELERIKDSIIVIDEFSGLFDLEDRKKRKQIETTLRLIYHNNNYILLSGLPENFKKFISGRINAVIFTSVTIADLINGSSIKKRLTNYQGEEKGSSYLALNKGDILVFNGQRYDRYSIPYMKDHDTKAKNKDLFIQKSTIKSAKNVQKKR